MTNIVEDLEATCFDHNDELLTVDDDRIRKMALNHSTERRICEPLVCWRCKNQIGYYNEDLGVAIDVICTECYNRVIG